MMNIDFSKKEKKKKEEIDAMDTSKSKMRDMVEKKKKNVIINTRRALTIRSRLEV